MTLKSGQRDTVLLALEMEEGGREPRNVGDPRRWKRQGNGFLPAHPPEPPYTHTALLTP